MPGAIPLAFSANVLPSTDDGRIDFDALSGRVTAHASLLSAYDYVSVYGSLSSAIASIGSSRRELVIDLDATVSSDLTVPGNVRLRVQPERMITIASGKTLTINGSVEDTEHQIFTGSGSVVFGKTKQIRAVWFGAVGDYATDDTVAISRALAAVPSGGTLVSDGATYRVGSTLTPTNKQFTWKGGRYQTGIYNCSDDPILDLQANSVENCTFEDIAFVGHTDSHHDAVIHYSGNTFHRCRFSSGGAAAAYGAAHVKGWENEFDHCTFTGPKNGLILDTDANNNTFDTCVFGSCESGSAALVALGGRNNTVRCGTFEGSYDAMIIKKCDSLIFDNCNWETNTNSDVSFQAASPQRAYGEIVGGQLVNADILGVRFIGGSMLSENIPGHIRFDGGIPNGLVIDGLWTRFADATFVVNGSEPGYGFDVRPCLFQDNGWSAGNYNVWGVGALQNSVQKSWRIDADSYQVAEPGYLTSYSGWKRPNTDFNLATADVPPTNWTTTLTGGSTFATSTDVAWPGQAAVAKLTRPTNADTCRASRVLDIPPIDTWLTNRWWTVSLWVMRTTAKGRVKITLNDGESSDTQAIDLAYADRWYQVGFSKYHDPQHATTWTVTLEDDDPDSNADVVYVAGLELAPGINCRRP